MTLRRKGRAHLERLLGHAEQVVRVSPADVLVLTGVSEQLDPRDLERLPGLLTEEGLECRGVVALGKGMGIESIDLDEIIHMDRLAAVTEQGTNVIGRSTVKASTTKVACPRCETGVPVDVSVHIVDDTDHLYAFATLDQDELELHKVVCSGFVLKSQ